MGKVAKAVKSVTKVFKKVGEALFHVVEQIVETVSKVVESIAHAIGKVIGSIYNFVKEHLGLVLGVVGVASAVLAVSGALSPFWAKLGQVFGRIPGFSRLGAAVARIRSAITSIRLAVSARLHAWFDPLIAKARFLWARIKAPINNIILKIKQFHAWLKNSIIGKIYSVFSKIAGFLAVINTFTSIVRAVREKEYAKAFWITLKTMDEKFAVELENAVKAVVSEISEVYSTLRGMIDGVVSDLRHVDAKARYVEQTLKGLYDVFGIKVFRNMADEVARFRKGVLRTVGRDLTKARGWLRYAFRLVGEPGFRMLEMFRDVERIMDETENMKRYMSYRIRLEGRLEPVALKGVTFLFPKEVAEVLR